MSQPGFFDLSDRYQQLSEMKDPLEKLNLVINWNIFLPLIKRAFEKTHKSHAGRKPYNRLMMFKILVLQSLYNLSDHQLEYQIRDRLSFMRFLGIELEELIPDEKTIWSFREILVKGKMIERLFIRFEQHLNEQGFDASLGMIVDASIVEVPKQRNSRDDNKEIKEGKIPESFKENPNKLRQKDMNARWTMKANQVYYGYKDHINVDVKHKLIRKYVVTPASTGDIKCLSKLIHGQKNTDRKLWGDGAYHSRESEILMKKYQLEDRLIFRVRQGNWIPEMKARENSRRAKIRKRVEHVFGFMQNSMNKKFIRTIGIARANAKIGLMNLVYNFCRYEQLCRIGAS